MLTPDMFAYRSELTPAMMTLTARGSATRLLINTGQEAVSKWDEKDAFFWFQREDVADHVRYSPGVGPYGAWAMGSMAVRRSLL